MRCSTREVLKLAGIKEDKKDKDKVEALFFISRQQAEGLARLILTNPKPEKKDVQTVLNAGNGVEISLFGRMVASAPELNVDASAQVAHAISTHRVETEYDFFTAVDDITQEDNSGAGMMGTIEFNSATLYRYATIAAHDLFCQLHKDPTALETAIREFVRAFALSMPGGKQNTFAAQVLPDAVLVCLRTDRPVSFAGAFEKPITAQASEGYAGPSAQALQKYAKEAYGDFCGAPKATYTTGQHLAECGKQLPLEDLVVQAGADTVALLSGALV